MIAGVTTSELITKMALAVAAELRECGHAVGKVLIDHAPLRLECCEECGLTVTVWVERFFRTSQPPVLIAVPAGTCQGIEVLEVHVTVASCYPMYEPGETVPVEDDIREPAALALLGARDCLAAWIDCEQGIQKLTAQGVHFTVVEAAMARSEMGPVGEPSCAGWEYVLNVW